MHLHPWPNTFRHEKQQLLAMLPGLSAQGPLRWRGGSDVAFADNLKQLPASPIWPPCA